MNTPRECGFPGCTRPPKLKKPGSRGRAPKYCDDPEHTPLKAKRALEKLAQEAQPERTAQDLLQNATLHEIRQALNSLTVLASLTERPAPTTVNPPEHPMAGWEWRIEQRTVAKRASGPPTWWVRAVDDPEYCGSVYISSPDSDAPGEDFGSVPNEDALNLALAIIAAVERSEQQRIQIPSISDRRKT